ncbi:MAG: hypothetical protein A2Z96_02535 [Spirochaetes bacterium GWB1_48_6]|nr:MAG: hypothetical protein A2Z96_02535 [Spirochaetes bacterium GWB1_48_6]
MSDPQDSVFQDQVLPLFQQLIQNQCVNTGDPDSGGEIRSAQLLQDFFNSYGIPSEILETRPGRSNLLVRIPGTDPQALSLAYMGHMDVVPAQRETWSHPPFEAVVDQEQIWGRGAVDMLCWTATQAVGLAQAVKNHGPFSGDLAYFALADEEAAGTYGARFLTRDHWDKVKCDYMVTELGGFFLPTTHGPAAAINLGEKGVCWLKLRTKGTPGHGSMPYGMENALDKIARVVVLVEDWNPPLRPHPAYKTMAKAMGKTPWEKMALSTGWGERTALKTLSRRNPGMARFLHTAGRTTISPNLLSGGTKINIIPDSGELGLDIRFLPQDVPGGQTPEVVIELVKTILGPELAREFTFEVLDFFPSNSSHSGGPFYEATENLLQKAHPDAHLMDMFIGGVTDGRFWRQKGTQVYGYCLFDQDMTMDAYGQRIHGIDERISISSLEKAYTYFRDLPKEFFGGLVK